MVQFLCLLIKVFRFHHLFVLVNFFFLFFSTIFISHFLLFFIVEASNFQEILKTYATSKCVTKMILNKNFNFPWKFQCFPLIPFKHLFFMWKVSFCFERIPSKLICQKFGLIFSLAVIVFKIFVLSHLGLAFCSNVETIFPDLSCLRTFWVSNILRYFFFSF